MFPSVVFLWYGINRKLFFYNFFDTKDLAEHHQTTLSGSIVHPKMPITFNFGGLPLPIALRDDEKYLCAHHKKSFFLYIGFFFVVFFFFFFGGLPS